MNTAAMTKAALVLSFLAATSAAHATETITYTYDEHGRLVAVVTSGTVNNGETVTVETDKADNRTTYTVTGA
jgi:YD repeat-containing protein